MHERYRIREAVRHERFRAILVAVEGEDRIFDSWYEAHREARSLCTEHRAFVAQSVMVDHDGTVVFPPEGSVQRTTVKWLPRSICLYRGCDHKALRTWATKQAVADREARRGVKPARDRRQSRTCDEGRRGLSKKTAERIADIRKENPAFGTPARGEARKD
jgi:hypothetical protein